MWYVLPEQPIVPASHFYNYSNSSILIYQYPGTNLGVMNNYAVLNVEFDMFIVLESITVENLYE